MNDLYGQRGSGLDWMGWQADISAAMRAGFAGQLTLPSPIATAAYAFVDSSAYAAATYSGTARSLATLERTVGSQRFAAAMKT